MLRQITPLRREVKAFAACFKQLNGQLALDLPQPVTERRLSAKQHFHTAGNLIVLPDSTDD